MSDKHCANGYGNHVKKIKQLDANIQNLLRQATETREFAYCPYSNFKVGAAILCSDGSVFSGCNIENAAFTAGLCAERCAYGKAISQGKMQFKAVAVIGQQEHFFTTPCGVCRQFMSEFGKVDVYISKPGSEDVLALTLEQLLPFQFETTGQTFV
ncbi:cytidine deaminase-like [Anthonomus grandis grandis]|uniref:cytidine deaminase-like n=1 Tax=Anthonomus grandis grandis TaxID=2921223 RepID=UPI002165B20C|nr:cytidine deaminase-like [Anthonomus grandis grandis]